MVKSRKDGGRSLSRAAGRRMVSRLKAGGGVGGGAGIERAGRSLSVSLDEAIVELGERVVSGGKTRVEEFAERVWQEAFEGNVRALKIIFPAIERAYRARQSAGWEGGVAGFIEWLAENPGRIKEVEVMIESMLRELGVEGSSAGGVEGSGGGVESGVEVAEGGVKA